MTKSNHRVNLVRISEIKKHPNADTLCIIPIPQTDYQYVGKIGDLGVGDLAAYIQPDSVLPEKPEFAWFWEPRTFDGPVPVKHRRVTARRFRKEWSEGLLIRLPLWIDSTFVEGDDVAGVLGVTHYEPPEDSDDTRGENERGPQYRRFPRSLKGWFYYICRLIGFDLNGATGGANEKAPGGARPVYDVEALKNFKDAFVDGEAVIVTEKIHGSNARYTFENSLLGGKMFAGSRKLWKSPKSKCVWRKALEQHGWIEKWCRANPGYTLYGEVVPTQDGYRYSCADGQVNFLVFDVLKPDGSWMDEHGWMSLGLQYVRVPVVYVGPYGHDHIKKLATGPSLVDAGLSREGVVVRPLCERQVRGVGRLQLKVVSNEFLEKQTRVELPKAA